MLRSANGLLFETRELPPFSIVGAAICRPQELSKTSRAAGCRPYERLVVHCTTVWTAVLLVGGYASLFAQSVYFDIFSLHCERVSPFVSM